MKKYFITIILTAILCSLSYTTFAQISVETNLPIDKYMNSLIGSGIFYNDVKFKGNNVSIGKFTIGNNPIPNFNISSGIMLSTGFANDPDINSNANNNLSDITNGGSDADIASLFPNIEVNDAVSLEFNFIPTSDSLSFKYIFASEEYPEWVCSNFNDVFCFLLTGPNPDGGYYNKKNIALIPGTNLPVAINSINSGVSGSIGYNDCISLAYSYLYVDNTYSNVFAYDGFSKVLEAKAKVIPCQQYRIKLVIADLNDQSYNSSVFIESNSFSSSGNVYTNTNFPNSDIVGAFTTTESSCLDDNSVDICFSIQKTLALDTVINYKIKGTAENGVDYELIPNSITIPKGEVSKCIKIKPIKDNALEETETIFIIPEIDNICNLEDTIKVFILDYDSLRVNESADTIICKGNKVNLFVNAESGYQPYTYSWNLLPNGQSHNITPQTTTKYIYTVKDKCHNTIVGEIIITVDSASVSLGNDLEVCPGDTVQINAITNAPNILWSTNETTPSISVIPYSDTTISVHVSSLACTNDDTLFIKTLLHPEINVSTNVNEICAGEHAIISVSGTAEALFWESHPIDMSMMPQGTNNIMDVSPSTTTTYIITGTNSELTCPGISTITIKINNCDENIIFPNVITPNSDGFNDCLVIKGIEAYSNSELIIYNRWGNIVFHDSDYKNDWSPSNMPDGTYYYILKTNSKYDNAMKEYNGSITIIK